MDPIDRTHALDLPYNLLALLREDELRDHPAIAAPLMAASNIVAEHHVPDPLITRDCASNGVSGPIRWACPAGEVPEWNQHWAT